MRIRSAGTRRANSGLSQMAWVVTSTAGWPARPPAKACSNLRLIRPRKNRFSTIVVAKLADDLAEISWVGDSRAYLWRKRGLSQISRDHSFHELLRAQNILTEEQIRADPRGNLVTQTLGLGDPMPSITEVSLRYGDWILLCSDGLNGELEDSQIAAILASSDDVQQH